MSAAELVTDEMVELAAEAAYTEASWNAGNFTGTNWDELGGDARRPWLSEAEAALEAVAPLIAARALQGAPEAPPPDRSWVTTEDIAARPTRPSPMRPAEGGIGFWFSAVLGGVAFAVFIVLIVGTLP